jgi:amino acid permease
MAEKIEYATATGNDYPEHERTYDGFVHFTAVGTACVLAIVAALAVGGTSHRWGLAGLLVFLSVVAGALGLFSRTLSWKPSALMLVLGLLALALNAGGGH